MTSFFQLILLYMQIYIPFVAVFWLSFGGEDGKAAVNKVNSTSGLWTELRPVQTARLTSLDSIVSKGNLNQKALEIYNGAKNV